MANFKFQEIAEVWNLLFKISCLEFSSVTFSIHPNILPFRFSRMAFQISRLHTMAYQLLMEPNKPITPEAKKNAYLGINEGKTNFEVFKYAWL